MAIPEYPASRLSGRIFAMPSADAPPVPGQGLQMVRRMVRLRSECTPRGTGMPGPGIIKNRGHAPPRAASPGPSSTNVS
jgi:hypothetical protein